jgi:hypothetical protein
MASKGPSRRPEVGDTLLVIHDFVARSSDELNLKKGDRVELQERDDEFGDGWFLGRHLGSDTSGLFPEGQSVGPARVRTQTPLRAHTLTDACSLYAARGQGCRIL